MAAREINFGLPPPPGARKEQFYYDYPDTPQDRRQQQFYNQNNNVAQQPQRRVTFSASTDGNAGGLEQQQQQQRQLYDEPSSSSSYPHTTYSPNRILGLGATSAAGSSPVFYYTRNYSPAAQPGIQSGSGASPYYSLYSYTSSPYYSFQGNSRYSRPAPTTSTATASNLAGPGRNLGRLYSFLGRRLEALMSFLAVSLGFGPDATALRLELAIKETAEDVVRGVERPPMAQEKKRRKLNKECVRLLEYTDAREFLTQFNALTRLLHIASIREVPDREIAHAALAGVQVLQWMQTLKRSIQRRGRLSYAPEEFRQLLKLHADVTAALSGRWGS